MMSHRLMRETTLIIMLKRFDLLFWLLAAILLSRLLSMTLMPMVGTTEARYSEIARIMAETGDWITPWFNYGVPFWGKPPLSFWSEALSFRLFGITEFAARLPSWLANLGTLALIYRLTCAIANRRQALIACLIFSTMALSYIMSGAVLTDPFLAFGTTLSFVSIILAFRTPNSLWRWWFFVGLAIGLLAKGPLALVLIGGPLTLWVAWRRQWNDLRRIPWARGMLIVLLVSLPWYVAAELKTPGFIQYFIIGEHFLRFVDSGWSGDLYGSAHERTFGTIWLYWVWASFPWGPIAIAVLIWRKVITKMPEQRLNDEQRLLLILALFPTLFFTFSSNILWTYQLPALAPLAILIAMLVANSMPASRWSKFSVITATALVPFIIVALGFYGYYYPEKVNTEKSLVAYYDEHKEDITPNLIYIGKPPFSARFYSRGRVTSMTLGEVESFISSHPGLDYYVAVPRVSANSIIALLPGQINMALTNKRFTLLTISPPGME